MAPKEQLMGLTHKHGMAASYFITDMQLQVLCFEQKLIMFVCINSEQKKACSDLTVDLIS